MGLPAWAPVMALAITPKRKAHRGHRGLGRYLINQNHRCHLLVSRASARQLGHNRRGGSTPDAISLTPAPRAPWPGPSQ